jgi:hypothetical protein
VFAQKHAAGGSVAAEAAGEPSSDALFWIGILLLAG